MTTQTRIPIVPLAEVVSIERKTIVPSEIAPGIRYVGLEHIDGDEGGVESVPVTDGMLASTKHRFTPEHLLFGKLRPYLRKIACPDFDGVCSTDILPIRVSQKLDRRYLFHYLRTPRIVALATTRSEGANLPRLSPRHLMEFPIPVPSIPEQKRIAITLDKADAIRRKRQASLRLTDEYLRSVFVEFFGDPATNTKGWQCQNLESAFSGTRPGACCGPFGSLLRKHEYSTSGVPVWGIDNVGLNNFIENGSLYISEKKFEELLRYRVLPGDILVSRAGTVGRMCVANPNSERSIIGTNLIRLTLNDDILEPLFFTSLYTFCGDRLPGLKASSDDGAYSFVNTSLLRRMIVPMPPIALQRRFVEIVRQTRAAQDKLRIQNRELRALFAALQHHAFRGAWGLYAPETC